MLEETLNFVNGKVDSVTEEIEDFDMESNQLSFNALESIDSARETLKVFFKIFLDKNIWCRELENKLLEMDDQVIKLVSKNKTNEARVQYMIDHGSTDGYANHIQKQNAMTNMVQRQVDSSFIDNRDVQDLNLSAMEQTALTKMSLGKIVSNLRKNLQEQESKNQQISLKLDQALK